MSRETEAILAKWRELERAVAAIDDPALRTALEGRVLEVRREYQAAVQAVTDETHLFGIPQRAPDLAARDPAPRSANEPGLS